MLAAFYLIDAPTPLLARIGSRIVLRKSAWG
jgi:hypothetical protein